ncbi:phenylphosphate carboxylase subunit gamma [Chloroflexota bacterium]
MTEYVARVQSLSSLRDGEEVELFIQDLTPGPRKYAGEIVKAIVASSPDKLPGADILWLRSVLGRPYEKPWVIKITQKLGLTIPGRPYTQ